MNLVYASLLLTTSNHGKPTTYLDSKLLNQSNESIFRYDVMDHSLGHMIDFMISLRHVAKYNDDVIIFFYGGPIPSKIRNLAKKLDIQIKYIERTFAFQDYKELMYWRHVDALNYIQSNIKYDNIFAYDLDVWFDDLFNHKTPDNGCIFSGTLNPPMWLGHPIDENEIESFYNKVNLMFKKIYTKGIMGCYFGANRDNFIKKINQYQECIQVGLAPIVWGVDQFLFNYLFDFNFDVIDNSRVFDLSSSFCKYENDSFYTQIVPPYDMNFHKVSAYHFGACFKSHIKIFCLDVSEENLKFRNKHPDLYENHYP